MGKPEADGESGPRRTVPLFDPVAGMRAMSDIQAEGLRAASELLERVLGSEPDGRRPGSRPPSGDYAAVVDAWTDLLQSTVAALARPGQPGALTVPVDSDGVGPPVRLAVRETSSVAAEVWLHNGTFAAVGPLTMRCGQLTDSDGTVLEGADVCFEPRELAILPPRSSRAVGVSLATNGPLRPGTYRGTIQAHGAPRLWLPFEVAIESW